MIDQSDHNPMTDRDDDVQLSAEGAAMTSSRSSETLVSYLDIIEDRRVVERWPTEEQAWERYYVLINAAFALMVRLGETRVIVHD